MYTHDDQENFQLQYVYDVNAKLSALKHNEEKL